MHRPRRRSALILLAALAALPAAASAAGRYLDLEGRYWTPEVSGDVRAGLSGLATAIDLESDLGLGDDELLELRLLWHPGRRLFLRVAHLPFEAAGDRLVTRSLSFRGSTYEVGTRVQTALTVDYTRAALGWQLLSTDRGAFRFGPMIGVSVLRGEASLVAPGPPVPLSESRDFEAAFGSAGAMLDLELTDSLHLFAEASLLVGADEGNVVDAEAGIRYFFFGRTALIAGWRSLTVDAEEDDDSLDVTIDGLFAGVSIRF